MKRLIISMSILFLLVSFSLVPTLAEESDTAKTDYVAELNKLGIAGRPESDNAAPYYQKAIELYVKQPEGLKISPSSWPKEQPAKQHFLLKKWVQDNNRALEQLQLGSRKSYCWFQHTGQKLQQTEMPHLSTRRQLAFALQARAKLSAEDGNITSAVDDIVTLYKFGAHVADGPRSLVEKLVGIAVKALSIGTSFNLLDKRMVNADMMKTLEDNFKQLVSEQSEQFDIRGEKMCLQEQVETDPKYRIFKPYLKSTLEYYDTMAVKTPWQLHNETQSITEDNFLIETAGSAMPKVIEIESRIRTEEQALITTLTVLRYNADKRGYPAELSELVSAGYIKGLPKDPFSDKPLVYKQTRQGFTLYSFGGDFDDDGGLHSKWGLSEGGGDQVFWPLEQSQVAARQTGRERPFARTERPQRRATTYARSAAQPYLIDDEEEYVPARQRPAQETTTRSLHQAVVDGDIDQVNLLISKGADVNLRNRMNWTPLHTAIQNRRQAIVELLTTKGADVNAKDNRGQTPLHVAVNLGQKEVVELLIAKGVDVNVMGSRGDNALSLAQKRKQTEIVDLLLKHGAKEPSPQDLLGDRYYGDEGGASPYPNYEEQTIQRRTGIFRGGSSPTVQSPVQVDILADPNEIKARIKTFEGLQKALEEVAGKSQSEMRQWQQKRYDNRTLLIRAVQKQFEDEIGFIRKAAVEEKTKKTTETIDSLLSEKQERLKKVSKELLAQKRELRQTQPTRGRGRARTSGRSTRGRSSQRGQTYGEDTTDSLYDRGGVRPGINRYQSARGTARGATEQIDIETENEIRQWVQATVDDKETLAQAVHEQIRAEISSIRIVAVEEEAKKTTAAIDGVLLYRQMRFDEFFKKIEEEKQALRQQTQDPRIRGRGRFPQGGQIQQQNQPRTRGRRR